MPETIGAAVGSIPVLGVFAPLVERLVSKVIEENRRNVSRTLRIACAESGLSPEDLQERIDNHPELVPLVQRTLVASSMSGADDVIFMLAGFLGDAMSKPDMTDDAATLIGVVQGFSGHHVRVLEAVTKPVREEPPSIVPVPEKWTAGRIAQATGIRLEIAHATVRGLLNSGLLIEVGIDGGTATWGSLEDTGSDVEVSPLGKTVLEVLKRVRDAEASTGASNDETTPSV